MMIRLTKRINIKDRRAIWPQVEEILCPWTLKALAWGHDIKVDDSNIETLKVAFKDYGLVIV